MSEEKNVNNLISVIVPVYNVHRYLPRCIESVTRQTYTNWELILVDDGSTDNSGKICDKYARKDNRIKVIHKQNEGVSVARNVGISQSKGEYITFVDSDDWISRDCLKILFDSIGYGKYDLSLAKAKYITNIHDFKQHIISQEFLEYDFKNIDSATSFFSEENCWRAPWAKLFKFEIIKDNDVLFPKGVTLGEDAIFILDYLKYCKNIIQCNKHLYYYNRLLNSAVDKYHADYPLYAQTMILKELEIFKLSNHSDTTNFYNQLCSEINMCINMCIRCDDKGIFRKSIFSFIAFYESLGFSSGSLYLSIKNNIDSDVDKEITKQRLEYIANKDIDGLFDYEKELLGGGNQGSLIKKRIKKIYACLKSYIIFDLKIGYWK